MTAKSEEIASSSTLGANGPQIDSIVLSLLQAYCDRTPTLQSELRYLEIGGPPAIDEWRTQCVSRRLAAKGVLLSSHANQLTHLKNDRPQDIVIGGTLCEHDIASLDATDESSFPGTPANGESVATTSYWVLDNLIEQEFVFNRLDHLVIHGNADELWGFQSYEFLVTRPYMLQVVSSSTLSADHIHDISAHLSRRDFILIASQSRDLIFVDSLAFLRPEQSSSFIV